MGQIRNCIVIYLLVLAAAGLAQDESAFTDDCMTGLADIQSGAMGSIQQMDKAVLIDNVADWIESARGLRNYLAMADALCRGLSWDSETEGLQPVLGPVLFPDGLYRVTVTTAEHFILIAEPLGGDCEAQIGTTLFIVGRGDATQGAQTTFRATGCTALLSISNTSEPWTLTFELISS